MKTTKKTNVKDQQHTEMEVEVEVESGAKDPGEKRASMASVMCGWSLRKKVLMMAILLVVVIVIGGSIWFFAALRGMKEESGRGAALLRCLEDAFSVKPSPSESIGSVFQKLTSKFTSRLPLHISTRLLSCLERVAPGGSLVKALKQWIDGRELFISLTPKEWRLRKCMRGVVTVEPGGRFGNIFLAWASAWAVARSQNLTLATPTSIQDTLHQAFSYVPTGPTLDALLKACPEGDGLVEADAFRILHGGNFTPRGVQDIDANESSVSGVFTSLAFPKHVVFPCFIAPMAKDLRASVQWSETLIEYAQSMLTAFKMTISEELGVYSNEVVFVGMHARRTDYLRFIMGRHNASLKVDTSYFLNALRHLSRILEAEARTKMAAKAEARATTETEAGAGVKTETEAGAKAKTETETEAGAKANRETKTKAGAKAGGARTMGPLVVVVVSSDDMPWVSNVLLPEIDNFTQGTAIRAFAGGSGTYDTTLDDLALLSACNHTIMSFGTYGMTAALLSGGHVVALRVDPSYATSEFAKHLPHWSLVR